MSQRELEFTDELGPEKIVYIYEPRTTLRAILVIDNVAAGPSIGGIRMVEDGSSEETFRLARAMTLKNAAAGLAHGGGKSIILADPKMAKADKEVLIRAFACAIADIKDYIPGPDMGTNEECMAWIRDEIDRVVGLPREVGGIPLDEIGATGFGLAVACKVVSEESGMPLKGARVAVQGFGAVGKHAARFLAEQGSLLVAAADSSGTLIDGRGFDVQALIEYKNQGKPLCEYPHGEKHDIDAIIDVECDIWIPAARPDVVRDDNVNRLKTRIIAEGANIPIAPSAEEVLWKRGIHVIPDFIANAGGVICAAVEYHHGNQSMAMETIKETISRNTKQVFKASQEANVSPRSAAIKLATERVKQVMTFRR